MQGVGGRQRDRGDPSTRVWLVYLGAGSDDDSGLVLAAVTGTEAEAWSMLTQARSVLPDRPNLVEDRPFAARAAPGGRGAPPRRSGLGVGERRTVFVLVTGPEDQAEAHGVFASLEAGARPRDDLRVHGFDDARLREVVTNTWLVSLPT